MIKIKLVENDQKKEQLEILGATLLSIEEYRRYRKNISTMNNEWWLRPEFSCNSHDYSYFYFVNNNNYEYSGLGNFWRCVRPVLKLNFNSIKFNIGDKFYFGGYKFQMISDNLALCDSSIAQVCYSREQKANATDYNVSIPKKYIDEWFNKSKEKDYDFFNKKNIDFMLQNDNPELKSQLLQINHDLGQDKKEIDLSLLDMSDEEFQEYVKNHPEEFEGM